MAKIRTTLAIDAKVWKAVRVRAARMGKRDCDIIEAALRRELGFDPLERIWAWNDMPEDEAMELALEAQGSVRRNDGPLAEEARAVTVSGDEHLLALAGRFPVRSPAEFRSLVRAQANA